MVDYKMNYLVGSGPTAEDDISRLEHAIKLGNTSGEPYKIVISGIGPDLQTRLKMNRPRGLNQKKFYWTNGLDVHPELWNVALDKIDGIFGVDTQAVTSKGNLIYSLPEGQEGNWTMSSRLVHLVKFKLIERKLKKKGRLSESLRLDYSNSGYSSNPIKAVKDIVYDCISVVKQLYDNLRNQ